MDGRRLGIAALAVLVVVDLILIALALRPAPTPQPVVLPVAPPVESTTESAQASPAAASSSPTSQAEVGPFDPAPVGRLVAVRADGTALAVVTGTCDQTSSSGAEISADGAAQPTSVPGSVMGRVTTKSDGDIELVAAAGNCDGELLFSEGQSTGEWTPEGEPSGVAYMLPGADGIVLSSGQVALPCDVRSFAPGGTTSTVLCLDGSVLTGGSNGWSQRGSLPSGLALSAVAAGNALVGVATADDCPGVTVHNSTDNGATWNRLSCLASAATDTGPVGIGAQGSTVVVVDGNGTAYRSTDSGGFFTQGG